jgi:hypothetical protein
MSTYAEARAFDWIATTRVVKRNPIDACSAETVVLAARAPRVLFDYAADLARSQAEFIAQGAENREEG